MDRASPPSERGDAGAASEGVCVVLVPPPGLSPRAAVMRDPDQAVPLAELTTLGVGGAAERFITADDEASLVAAVAWAKGRGLPTRILGGGSNVVIPDAGVSGLVIRIASRGRRFVEAGDTVELEVAAGEPWDDVVLESVRRNLQGLECLSGIPGLAGATPIQNVGAYGQEVRETIVRVRALDRTTLDVVDLPARECGFSYRDSRFKSVEPDRFVVLGVTFALRPGGAPALRYAELTRHFAGRGETAPSLAAVREATITLRRAKSMVFDRADENHRSCGSFFTNPVVTAEHAEQIERAVPSSMPRYPQPDGRVKLAAGWLIERAGFEKGLRRGAVGLSTRHALAIVAHEGATARAVLALADEIRSGVRARFGVELALEPALWG
jgi:UDP-N-acetylmuramate dehydrogenase